MPQDAPLFKALRVHALATGLALAVAGYSIAFAASLEEARSLAGQGKIEQAIGAVDDVLVKRPKDVSAQLLRGVLLSRVGRSDEAIEVFNAIAKSRPELPEPHNNLAVLYAAQGRYEEARGALVEAIRLQPDYALAHENLGDVYAKLAALSYSRANQIDPGDGSTADKSVAAENLIGSNQQAIPPRPKKSAARSTPRSSSATPAPVPALEPSEQSQGTGSAACVRIKNVAPRSRADGVARWLQQRGMETELTEGDKPATASVAYRVFIPSLGSKANARKRIAELREAGVSDLIMITDAGERYGISLGVFARRESAERRIKQLKGKGIESQIAERNRSRPAASTVDARGVFAPADFARAFPDLLPEMVTCP